MASVSQIANNNNLDSTSCRNGERAIASHSDGKFLSAVPSVVRDTFDPSTQLLDQSIVNVLVVAREALAMDLVFVSKQVFDNVVVSHASSKPGEANIRGMTHPFDQSFCQRVLESRLPAVIPDVAALSFTHDVPVTPLTPGAYMTTPVDLQDGTLYGFLCCIRWEAAPELGERHHQRLKMSARQIARLVDEAGER